MFCKSFLSRALISLFIFNSLIAVPDVFASENLKVSKRKQRRFRGIKEKDSGKINKSKYNNLKSNINKYSNKINVIIDKKSESKESIFLAPYPVLKNHEIEEKNNNKLIAKEKIINHLKSKGFELNIDSSKEDEYFNTEIKTRYPVEPLTWCEGHPLNVAKQLLENKKQDIRSWCGIYCNNNIFEKNKELFKEFDSFKPSMKTKTIGDIYESILIYLYTISRFQNEICGSQYGFDHGFGLIKYLLDNFFENGKICGYNGEDKNDTRVVYRSACILAGTPGCLCIDMVYGYDRLKKFDLRFKIAS